MRFFNLFTPARTEIVRKKSIDVALCGRSERPQNRADATPCLSDVYNIGTRARRRTVNIILSGQTFLRRVLQIHRDFLTTCTQKSTRGKKSQVDVALCGRSMVEMLGVLAIIGVLSVGAMGGYSKAMMKYKFNKQTEQIGSILDFAALYADQLRETNTWYGTELLVKLGAIPKEMIDTGNRQYIYDVFRNPILIAFTGDSSSLYHSMKINIGDHAYDICLNLFQMAKLRSAFVHQTVFTRDTEEVSDEHTNRVFGDDYCTPSLNCLKDLTLSQMYELCQTCAETNKCTFHILWNYRKR